MSSPTDISDRTKRRLEQLQAQIEAATDREVSQREVLDRIVRREYESRDDFIDSFRKEMSTDSGDWEGLSEEEVDVFLSGTSDWGFETSEEEIDEILYGR